MISIFSPCPLALVLRVFCLTCAVSITDAFSTTSLPSLLVGRHYIIAPPSAKTTTKSRLLMFNLSNDHVKKRAAEQEQKYEMSQAKVAVLEDVVRQVRAERDALRVRIQEYKAQLSSEKAVKEKANAENFEKENQWKQQIKDLERKQKELKNAQTAQSREFEKQTLDYELRNQALEIELKAVHASLLNQQNDTEEREQQHMLILQELQDKINELDVSLSNAALEISSLEKEKNHIVSQAARRQQEALEKAKDAWKIEQDEALQIASAAVEASRAREEAVLRKLDQTKAQLKQVQKSLSQQQNDHQMLWNDNQLLQQQLHQQQTAAASSQEHLHRQVMELQQQVVQLSAFREMQQQESEPVHRGERRRSQNDRPGLWGRIRRKFFGYAPLGSM